MVCGFRGLGATIAIVAGTLAPTSVYAGPLDPTQFQSLGTLALTASSATFNTTGPTPTLVAGTTVYTGVVYNGIAVFDFSSVSIVGATLLAAGGNGSLPIALLSRSTENIDGIIDVSASESKQGAGASNTGVGGDGAYHPGTPPNYYDAAGSGGGGGGFGGAGGMGGNDGSSLPGGAGGKALANLASILQGGSAGGFLGGYGDGHGNGGGAIELGATQSITTSKFSFIEANGSNGYGGGGSGGGIFIHAPTLSLSGNLGADGGAGEGGDLGPAGFASSGGGGGGAILLEFDHSIPGSIINGGSVAGGLAGMPDNGVGTSPGSNGVFQIGQYTSPVVPEPSSLVLLGTSTLSLLGMAAIRRHRRRAIEPRGERLAF